MKPEAHISDKKRTTVKELAHLFEKYPVIGALDIENLPAPQFQVIREKLRESALIRVAKRSLIYKAIENAGAKRKGLEKLKEYMGGMPGLIFSGENPFRLARTIQQNKSRSPIKRGHVAPIDISVKAGRTSFSPGPIIGELGALNIKAKIDGGKVVITEDKLLVKAGEKVSQRAADMLARLDVHPMEIGLDLKAVLESGEILPGSVLFVNTDEYMQRFINAHAAAHLLSIGICYPIRENINNLLCNAYQSAYLLALNRNILTKETVSNRIADAHAMAKSLSDLIANKKK